MNETDIFLFMCAIILFVVIIIEWAIGRAIGKAISKSTGIVLGIILIICGVSFIAGITIIVYSSKNIDAYASGHIVNVNINQTVADIPNNRINGGACLNVQDRLPAAQYEQKAIPNYNKQTHSIFIKQQNFSEILLKNDLYNYIGIFKDNKLDSMSIVKTLNENDLEKLGITIMGDRKKILQLIDGLSVTNDTVEFTIQPKEASGETQLQNNFTVPYIVEAFTHIRETPDLNAPKITEINKNEIVEVLSEADTRINRAWYKVKYKNHEGWCLRVCLKKYE